MNKSEIRKWCAMNGITDYTIRTSKDGLFVDVNKSVRIIDIVLSEFPFKFGTINGNFDCNDNNLTTLKGAPDIVLGRFSVFYNHIESLEYFPKRVTGVISITHNKISSFKGLPKFISEDHISNADRLWCYSNINIKEEDYFHLFDLGYDVISIKGDHNYDLKSTKRRWIIHNISEYEQ